MGDNRTVEDRKANPVLDEHNKLLRYNANTHKVEKMPPGMRPFSEEALPIVKFLADRK